MSEWLASKNNITFYTKILKDVWRKAGNVDVALRSDLCSKCEVGAKIALEDGDPFCKTARLFNKDVCFPLNITQLRGIPVNSHPGAFGCARKYNFHEGVDLYCYIGTQVFAMRDCEVVSVGGFTGASVGMSWWLETKAVTVKCEDDDGREIYHVYGEIEPMPEIEVGVKLRSGQHIGNVLPVLPHTKHRSDIPFHEVSMLHFEKYNHNYSPSYGWAGWEARDTRPIYLEDPTNDLLSVLKEYCGKKLIFK